MRLKTLFLRAFGPFSNRTIELDPDKNFHLIYGPNESGKSSSLRALKTLLYGFGRRTTDNFIHPSRNLNVGGLFQSGDGREFEVYRWKKLKGSLTDAAGNPIPEKELSQLLVGVNKESFERLYGLSHHDIVSGGLSLLSSGGQVGQSLFSAALGPEYQELQKDLKARADEIWSPRSAVRPLNERIKAWEEARQSVQSSSLSSDAYREIRESFEAARQSRDELRRTLAERRAQLEEHKTLLQAAPEVLRRRELLSDLEDYAETPDLGEDFQERRTSLLTERARLRQELETTRKRSETLSEKLKRAQSQDPITEAGERIGTLNRQLAKMTETRLELPKLEAKQRENLAQQKRQRETIELPEGLKIPAPGWVRKARELAQQWRELLSKESAIGTQKLELEEELPVFEEFLRNTPEKPLSEAESAVLLARRQRGLDEKIQMLESDIRSTESSLKLQLSSLSCWSGSAADLREIRVPSPAMVEEHARRFAQLTREHADSLKVSEELNHERQALEKSIADLALSDGDKLLEQLYRDRAARDELWEELSQAWVQGESAESCTALVSQFESSLAQCDEVSDSLRQMGESLLVIEQTRKRQSEVKILLAEREKDLAEKAARLQELEQEWESLWEGSQVILGPAQQMLVWLQQREEILSASVRLEHRAKELEIAKADRDSAMAEFAGTLEALGMSSLPRKGEIASLIELAERALERWQKEQSQRDSKVQSLERLRRQIESSEQKLSRTRAQTDSWEGTWATHMDLLKGDFRRDPEDLEDLLQGLEALGELESEARKQESRIRELSLESKLFEDEVKKVSDFLETEPGEDDIRLVERAQVALMDATQVQEESRRNREELQGLKSKIEILEQEMAASHESFEQLLLEASVEGPEQLTQVLARARKKFELQSELKALENSLRGISLAASLADFCARVEGQALESLPLTVAALEAQIEGLSEELQAQSQSLGRLEQELESLDGSAEAARSSQEAELNRAEGISLSHRYVRYRMAEELLGRAMESYRRKNEGPVLERAAFFLNRLTAQNYRDLKTGLDGKGELILLVVARDGTEKSVEALSDGTCDQLFLALRLAIIEQSGAPLPLMADDILVQFDEERARSTMQALCDFGEKTQVILFSHLERDLKVAESLGEPWVDIIRLEGFSEVLSC